MSNSIRIARPTSVHNTVLDQDSRRDVVITQDEHHVNDQVVAALVLDPELYQRGGSLVHVVHEQAATAGAVNFPAGLRIMVVSNAGLRERLTRVVSFVKEKAVRGGVNRIPAHPPEWCVSAVFNRGNWPGVRPLSAVVDHPILRPDGTILSQRGYDPATGLYLDFDGDPPELPMSPTLDDATAARDLILEVVRDFPFEQPVHRASWLAAVLTPLARFAFSGPAPLFLIDKNVRGAGSGLLVDTIALIVTGREFAAGGYTDDDDETRKTITSIAIRGERLALLDNIDGRFGSASLDRALTATVWRDRVLGQNREVVLPLLATWYATGNNVQVAADTARRVCPIRLLSSHEHTEDRSDFVHPDLRGWVRNDPAQRRPALRPSAAAPGSASYVRYETSTMNPPGAVT